MTTITLQEYHERIEKLIDENLLTDAITHCRHILETHPSNISTYRLLAKALLEQHEYDGAADLFQRVLSADPNDFVAHVGLSIVRAEESQVEDALWHLQRAFEIEPYNAAIQEELRRHYAQFSDMAVDRIPLTSGALARLYIKGELYHQAVQELRQTIQRSQDRIDLEVLLAEALWRNEQRVDAEEVCLNVLQKLPNCIAINAILSEIWLQTGRIGESQKYLRRLVNLTNMDKESLNLDTAVGRAFRAEGALPLPDKVELEFKGDTTISPATATTAAKGPSADWMNDVTFDSDMGDKFDYERLEVVGESPSGMHNYDWMADVNDDLAADAALPVESEWFVDEVLQAEPALEDDWLADVEMASTGSTAVADDDFALLFAEDGTTSPESDAAEREPEDWFLAQSESELQSEESFASEQLAPAWLVSLVDEPDFTDVRDDEAEANVGSDWFTESDAGLPLPATESNMPDWLSNLVDEGAPASTTSDFPEVDLAQTGVDNQNDWMIDEHAEDHWDEPEYTAEQMPDWLLKQTGELESEGKTVTSDGKTDDLLPAEESVIAELPEPSEDSLFTGWLSDEPEEVPALAKGAAALGLTAMFASLDDDLPQKEETTAEMDEWAGLFAETDDVAGMAVPSTPTFAETDEDDWLSSLAPPVSEADSSSIKDTAEPASRLDLDSDWLTMGEDVWADDLAADNLADLTPETMDVAAELALTFGGQTYLDENLVEEVEEEEIPDWLLGNDQAGLGKAEDMVMGVMGDEDETILPELPEPEDEFASLRGDWLSEFSTGDEEQELMDDDALDVTPVGEEVPDWLAGFEVDTGDEVAAEEEWVSATASPDEDMFDDTSVPDWLSSFEDTAVSDESPATSMMAALGDRDEEDELFDVLADMSTGESPMADWLTDDDFGSFAGEQTKEPVTDAAVPSGGLTSWLNSLPEDEMSPSLESEQSMSAHADIPEIPSEELFATDRDNLPDWLGAATSELIVTPEEESNLPDWLLGGASDVPDQLDSEDLFPTDEQPAFDGLADLDEMETGLGLIGKQELEEEVVDEGLTAVGLTALLSSIHDEPATVAGLGTETNMDWLTDMGEEEPLSALAMADEAELDWLVEETTVEEMETAVVPVPAQEEIGLDAPVADLDDAISWLEELASQQETPVEELPTVAQSLLAEELTELEVEDLAYQDLEEEDFDAVFDEALEEAWVEAFPADLTAVPTGVLEVAEPEEEIEEESWLDVLLADEEAETAALSAPPEDDPEAAMAWLEGLAANQGAPLEELPSLQGRSQRELDGLVDEAQADLDEALAWMDDLAEEPETKEEWPELDEALLASMMAGTAVTSSAKTTTSSSAVDDELAGALDLLDEQLRAEGISPAVSGGKATISDSELMAALDWLEEEQSTAEMADELIDMSVSDWEMADEVDLMDELTVAGMPAAEELAEAELWDEESWDWEQSESLTDLLTVVAKPTTGKIVDEEEEDLSLLDMPDDPDAAMEWLARMATDADLDEKTEVSPLFSEIEEGDETEVVTEIGFDEGWDEPAGMALPTAVTDTTSFDEPDLLALADNLDISDMPDDPDEAMNWLLSMAQGDAAIDFDMQPPPITPSEDAKFAIEYDAPTARVVPEPEIEVVEEMDTAVEVALLADTEVEDDAAWLEDMLSDDLTIDFDMQPPPITPSEDAKFAIEYDAPTASIVPEPEIEVVEEMDTAVEAELLADADMEDDAGWLEDMLSDDLTIDFDMQPPPITPSEDAKFAIDYDEPTKGVAEPLAEITPLVELPEEDLFTAVPEDPDEAMAWLQQLADQQTGALEPAGVPDDALLPAWLTGDETDIAEFKASPAAEAELDLIEDLGVDIEDDLSDSLPDWLATDSSRSSGTGQTGWLTAVEDIDVISWLAAEQEATAVDFDEAIMPETGDVRPSLVPSSDRLPSLTTVEPDMPAESFEVQSLVTDTATTGPLPDVRTVLAEKRYEEAADHYQQLIASGTATLGLIAELESLADEYPTQPAFRRLLGDAYMRNGQLQKALNTYRTALDQL